MANDERQSQTFIREVDEELRRDQLKALWKRFAPLIIGVCFLVVAVTAGYRGWMWWEERKAAQAGDRFMEALAKIEGGSREEGEAELAAIAADSDVGYSALARLRLAGEKAGAGAKKEALDAYDAVAADSAAPVPLRDFARMRAALLALDTGDLAGARERATQLNVAGSAWRHVAREVIGTAAYQAGDLSAAREAFTEIQQDAQTPPDLWQRSGAMVLLIDGQLPAPGTEASPAAPADAPSPQTNGAAPVEAPASVEPVPAPVPAPSPIAPAPSATTP